MTMTDVPPRRRSRPPLSDTQSGWNGTPSAPDSATPAPVTSTTSSVGTRGPSERDTRSRTVTQATEPRAARTGQPQPSAPGLHDQHHARQPAQDREQPPGADPLPQHRPGRQRDGQRRGLHDGGHVGQRHPEQREEEEPGRPGLGQRAQQHQPPVAPPGPGEPGPRARRRPPGSPLPSARAAAATARAAWRCRSPSCRRPTA